MNKKTLFGLIGVTIILGAAYLAYIKQPHINIKFNKLTAYFIKTDVPLEEDNLNYFIIENQDEMDAVLGIAKTLTNNMEKIDFDKDLVIAIAYPATNLESKININSVNNFNDNIYIDYSFTQGGEERSFSIIPAKIISFKKPKNMMDLYFTMYDNIDKKIAMGRRTLGSPLSIDDFKQNYTGTYEGSLPCADCLSIETKLSITPDMTYELSETYVKRTELPFKEEGKYTISDDLAQIKLEKSGTFYFIDDNKSLEKADTKGKRIDSDLNYRLIRE